MNLGFIGIKINNKAGNKIMKPIVRAGRMKPVHSDIRGPLFVEAMKRQKQGSIS